MMELTSTSIIKLFHFLNLLYIKVLIPFLPMDTAGLTNRQTRQSPKAAKSGGDEQKREIA
jgi:hypothetical protein